MLVKIHMQCKVWSSSRFQKILKKYFACFLERGREGKYRIEHDLMGKGKNHSPIFASMETTHLMCFRQPTETKSKSCSIFFLQNDKVVLKVLEGKEVTSDLLEMVYLTSFLCFLRTSSTYFASFFSRTIELLLHLRFCRYHCSPNPKFRRIRPFWIK